MKKIYVTLFLLLTAGFLFWKFLPENQSITPPESPNTLALADEILNSEPGKKPNDWIYRQRTYPSGKLDARAYHRAAAQSAEMQRSMAKRTSGNWEPVGPVNTGGRISDVEMSPSDLNTVWVGAASGGVWKSTDAGSNFTPVFDDQMNISVGDLVVDPNNPLTVYVGTGEANGGFNSSAFPGNGIYKTTDGGNNWSHLGLDSTEQIGRVVVDPKNSNRVFAAAMGRQYGKTQQRGIYRSTDAGSNWSRVLFVNDSTGAVDISLNPDNPDTAFAATWSRIRYPDNRIYAGPGSGIHRTFDGGDTWTPMTNGLPTGSNVGRLGVAVAPSNPSTIYAAFSDHSIYNYFNGIYKSTNNGDSWSRVDTSSYLSGAYSSFGWWFGNIRVDPNSENIVYLVGFRTHRSTDGGITWTDISGNVHVDHHGLYIHPLNSSHLFLGTDGGFYKSTSGGLGGWVKNEKLPVTQFYQIEVSESNPTHFLGGTQDNGTQSYTFSNNYEPIYWGDGFYVIVHPTVPSIIFAEYQYGNIAKSTDGGATFNPSDFGINPSDRKNWSTPYVMSETNTNVMYYGSQFLYKSSNLGDSWTSISQDLTNGPGSGALTYGTISTIGITPADDQRIYTGADDGSVWRTTNGGSTWTNITGTLPQRYCTRIAVSKHDADVVYATFSGYEYVDYLPHVFKSTDGGNTWTDISGNLPNGPANDIIPDPQANEVLYLATDFGVMYTTDGGTNWQPIATGMPNVTVFDLEYHDATRMLVAGTHGRSMYKLDLSTLITVDENPAPALSSVLTVGPNPVQEHAMIQLELAASERGELALFDLQGRKLQTIRSDEFERGKQSLRWEPAPGLASGNYLVRFISDKRSLVSRVVIAR